MDNDQFILGRASFNALDYFSLEPSRNKCEIGHFSLISVILVEKSVNRGYFTLILRPKYAMYTRPRGCVFTRSVSIQGEDLIDSLAEVG